MGIYYPEVKLLIVDSITGPYRIDYPHRSDLQERHNDARFISYIEHFVKYNLPDIQ